MTDTSGQEPARNLIISEQTNLPAKESEGSGRDDTLFGVKVIVKLMTHGRDMCYSTVARSSELGISGRVFSPVEGVKQRG
jgi:hypothetical protein